MTQTIETIPAAATTIDLTLTLTAPLHHGAGSAGNTSLLRTQDIVLPDGRQAAVPFVSGNSLRHQLRDALAWHSVTTLGIEPGTLSKATVDLLWSGGAITATGSNVDLDLARRVEDIYPALGLLGYAAQADIVAGTLRVDMLHLLCAENARRLPARLADHPHAARPAGMFRGEEFGTRHDVASTPVDRYVQTVDAIVPATTQMIYDLQVLKPGSILWGRLSLTPAATDTHARVLGAALQLLAGDGTIALAAKTAVGYGRANIDGVPDSAPADLDWWTNHLADRRDDIIDLVTGLTR